MTSTLCRCLHDKYIMQVSVWEVHYAGVCMRVGSLMPSQPCRSGCPFIANCKTYEMKQRQQPTFKKICEGSRWGWGESCLLLLQRLGVTVKSLTSPSTSHFHGAETAKHNWGENALWPVCQVWIIPPSLDPFWFGHTAVSKAGIWITLHQFLCTLALCD